MRVLEVPSDIVDQIISEAKDKAPVEACGILAGRGGRVTESYRMSNTDNSSVHFMMAPAEQFAVAKDIREKGLEMVAIYHSHPATPARPSAEDIRLALTEDVTYMIVSLQDAEKPVLKGFLIEDGNIMETPIRIVKGCK